MLNFNFSFQIGVTPGRQEARKESMRPVGNIDVGQEHRREIGNSNLTPPLWTLAFSCFSVSEIGFRNKILSDSTENSKVDD